MTLSLWSGCPKEIVLEIAEVDAQSDVRAAILAAVEAWADERLPNLRVKFTPLGVTTRSFRFRSERRVRATSRLILTSFSLRSLG